MKAGGECGPRGSPSFLPSFPASLRPSGPRLRAAPSERALRAARDTRREAAGPRRGGQLGWDGGGAGRGGGGGGGGGGGAGGVGGGGGGGGGGGSERRGAVRRLAPSRGGRRCGSARSVAAAAAPCGAVSLPGRWVIGERRYAPPPEGCREGKRDGAVLAACERCDPSAVICK